MQSLWNRSTWCGAAGDLREKCPWIRETARETSTARVLMESLLLLFPGCRANIVMCLAVVIAVCRVVCRYCGFYFEYITQPYSVPKVFQIASCEHNTTGSLAEHDARLGQHDFSSARSSQRLRYDTSCPRIRTPWRLGQDSYKKVVLVVKIERAWELIGKDRR